MRKAMMMTAVLLFASIAAWAHLRVTVNVQSVTKPNNCCYTLLVSIDDVDNAGQVTDHKVHGYVKQGCCVADVSINPATDNTNCISFIYHGEAFITAKDSKECLLTYIETPGVYQDYIAKRDAALSGYKSTH